MTDDLGSGFDPYTPPLSELQSAAGGEDTEAPRPVPFEDVEAMPGFWNRVGSTFGLAFQKPLTFFERVPVTEGLGAPLRFQFLLATPLILFMAFMGLVVGLVGKLGAAQAAEKNPPPSWLFPAMSGFYTVFIPLGLLLGYFIGGVLLHGLLWIWGGLRNGREVQQTLRAHGYFMAFYCLASLIPCVNYILPFVAPVPLGMGLARLHRTDVWRGICAAYTPLVLCCLFFSGVMAVLAVVK